MGGVPDLEGRARGGWERAGRRGSALRGRGRSRGGDCRARECATRTGHPTGLRYRFKRARVSPSRVETWPSSKLREQRSNSRSAGGEEGRNFLPSRLLPEPVRVYFNACMGNLILMSCFILYFEADCRRLQVRSLPGNASDFSWIVAISLTRMPRQSKISAKGEEKSVPVTSTARCRTSATRKRPQPPRSTPPHYSTQPTNMGFEDQVQKVGDWGE